MSVVELAVKDRHCRNHYHRRRHRCRHRHHRHQAATTAATTTATTATATATDPSFEESLTQQWYQTGRIGKEGSAPEYLIDLPIDKDQFSYFPAIGYLVNVIVDPCRGHEHDCCVDRFGTAEYVADDKMHSSR